MSCIRETEYDIVYTVRMCCNSILELLVHSIYSMYCVVVLLLTFVHMSHTYIHVTVHEVVYRATNGDGDQLKLPYIP